MNITKEMKSDQYADCQKAVTIIGGSVMDVLAGPVDTDKLLTGSQPMEQIRLSFGGDALNEAVALKRLGVDVDLITKVGCDDTGRRILGYLEEEKIETSHVIEAAGIETAVNIVLIDREGERSFLTNPRSSLRRLTAEDIEPYLDNAADIVSFASLFVSPLLTIDAMTTLFGRIKSVPGRILAADMTKAKQGEKLADLAGLLPYVDYLFPNEEEAALLTGSHDPYQNAEAFVRSGVGCAVIKLGARGCLIQTKEAQIEIPAYAGAKAVDTTGAGDCFAAGFLYGLSCGMPLRDCGRMACATASCSVEEVGAVTGLRSLDEMKRRMERL